MSYPTGNVYPPIATPSATKVVAASNSLRKNADYICDGTDDQAEINAAISSLGTSGGSVILLEGTYSITGPINLASNVALIGQGPGTVLRVPNAFNANLNVVSASGVSRVVVANLRIDGNRANQTAGIMNGVYFYNVTYGEIRSCYLENLRGEGIYLYSSNNNTVSGNTCRGNYYEGILLDRSSNNTVSGNTCQGNNSDGIALYRSSNNTVSGNTCQGNYYEGIFLWESSNNNICGNTCIENSQLTDNTYSNIQIFLNSDYNLISGNVCRRGALTNKPKYGINIATSDCDYNMVEGNDLYDSGSTGDLNDAGTNTRKRDNLGNTGDWLTDV